MKKPNKEKAIKELLNPETSDATFKGLLAYWVGRYPTVRQGVVSLSTRIEDTYGIYIHPSGLRKHLEGTPRAPTLRVAVCIASVVLEL